MFEHTSRYDHLENATYHSPDGRHIIYKRRRFLPQGATIPELREVTAASGDRLDLIAARALGDPLQFWRICDANNAMNPFELTAESGRALRVPRPYFQEVR